MLSISVQSTIEESIRKMRSFTEAKQLRFSTAQALTRTAYKAQAEVRGHMPQRFTIRRPWVVQGIRVDRATPDNLTARVYSRDKFMALQEHGGAKTPLGHYIAIPTSMVRRTPRDLIRKSDRPKALGDRAEIVEVKGHKYLALKKGRKGANGNQLRLLYLLVPRARIIERLGLARDGMQVVRLRFGEELRQALEENVARAR